MSQAKGKPKNHGPDAFDRFYQTMHPDRWAGLVSACKQQNQHFALSGGLKKSYFLDPASVIAALCLDIQPGQQVLDLCAAPGGKTLVIAQRLFGLVPASPNLTDLGQLALVVPEAVRTDLEMDGHSEAVEPNSPGASEMGLIPTGGFLVANERSALRRGRLRQVLADHLPEACQTLIKTSAFDATAWGQHEKALYDRILLDVPCSSERHLIQDPSYLREWAPRRSTQLAQQAYAMGLSAGQALKTGGILLYCTCALSELENDETVARIIERSIRQADRFGYCLESMGPVDLASLGKQLGGMTIEVETTRHGQRIWPDRSGGFGPLYFARLQKQPHQNQSKG